MRAHRRLSKQKPVRISLLHLPDELLLQVIDEADRGDLYALSVQCKRLQRLSLPPYLRFRGVTLPLTFPIDHLVITPEQLSVPGISLAFFSQNVRRFSGDIGYVQNPRATTAARLHRLFGIVVNLKGLEDLALDFKNWVFTVSKEHLTAQACVHCLEVVAERCRHLELSSTCDNLSRRRSYDTELIEKEAKKWRARRPLKGLFKAISLGTSRSRSLHVPGPYPQRSCTLKTLILLSDTFLLPPFSRWAFKILNTAPLTRLDLIGVYLNGHATLILGTLTIPTLEHLRVISSGLNFGALAKFLSRHSTISTFEIIYPPGHVYELPITTLPALVSLKSNLKDIDHLLTPTGAFPRLAHVQVVTYFSCRPGSMIQVEQSLARAAKRLAMANIRLCLDVLSISPHDFVDQSPFPYHPREHPVLSRVREIVFPFPYVVELLATAIPTWLSMFPLLDHIELIRVPMRFDYEGRKSFLRSIAQKCAGIRTVTIGDDTLDMSVWLSSDS